MALTNEARNSELANKNSDHQLLVLILTELRLHTYLSFQTEMREEDIAGLRAEIMNDGDIVDTEALTTQSVV